MFMLISVCIKHIKGIDILQFSIKILKISSLLVLVNTSKDQQKIRKNSKTKDDYWEIKFKDRNKKQNCVEARCRVSIFSFKLCLIIQFPSSLGKSYLFYSEKSKSHLFASFYIEANPNHPFFSFLLRNKGAIRNVNIVLTSSDWIKLATFCKHTLALLLTLLIMAWKKEKKIWLKKVKTPNKKDTSYTFVSLFLSKCFLSYRQNISWKVKIWHKSPALTKWQPHK